MDEDPKRAIVGQKQNEKGGSSIRPTLIPIWNASHVNWSKHGVIRCVKAFAAQLHKTNYHYSKRQIVPEYYPDTADDLPKPVPQEIQQGLIVTFRELMANPNEGLDYPFSCLGDLSLWYQDIENCKAANIASIQRTITGKITALPFVASLTESKDTIPAVESEIWLLPPSDIYRLRHCGSWMIINPLLFLHCGNGV